MGCDPANLDPASFDANHYTNVGINECDPDDEGKWYVCEQTSPPFMGCCNDNPCNLNGCPQIALVAAKLSINETESSAFSSILIKEPSKNKTEVGLISGSTVGAFALVAIVLFSI